MFLLNKEFRMANLTLLHYPYLIKCEILTIMVWVCVFVGIPDDSLRKEAKPRWLCNVYSVVQQ